MQPTLDEYLFGASRVQAQGAAERGYVLLAGESEMKMQDLRVLSQLGRGAFGQVLKCRMRTGLDVVAVKIMELSGPLSQPIINEIRVMITVKSQSMVRHICSFVQYNRVCIVMECVSGGTLKDFIRHCAKQPERVRLPARLLYRWGRQIASALYELHDMRLIHRDVKPANLMLTGPVYLKPTSRGDPGVKLGDLGLARILSDETIIARTKCGTPLYMAPEQVTMDRGYTEKVDVWALGCVLYELVMQKPPFVAATQDLLYRSITVNDPFDGVEPRCEAELWEIIVACLKKDPRERPSTRDLTKQLRALEKTEIARIRALIKKRRSERKRSEESASHTSQSGSGSFTRSAETHSAGSD
eukprot:gnl/Chilomastix_cuspidata/1482.p1 GENE.gnl/Chilomastix_cuspidata/1482~~gnl/Chilomastix_cuspidata/1482.p1  ORF type:complete len:357 (-),score=113.49 gnl/Chilomastix_cuspidata/1482:430-1500(-)